MPTQCQIERSRSEVAKLYADDLERRIHEDPCHRALRSCGKQIAGPSGVPLISQLISGQFSADPKQSASSTLEDGGAVRRTGRGKGKRVCTVDYVPPSSSTPSYTHKLIGSERQTFPVGWGTKSPTSDVAAASPQGLSSTKSLASSAASRSASAPPRRSAEKCVSDVGNEAGGGKPSAVDTGNDLRLEANGTRRVSAVPAREGTELWRRRILSEPCALTAKNALPSADNGTAAKNTSLADEPCTDKPSTDRPSADKPGAGTPTVDKHGAATPTAEKPGAATPTVDKPGAGVPTADKAKPEKTTNSVATQHSIVDIPSFATALRPVLEGKPPVLDAGRRPQTARGPRVTTIRSQQASVASRPSVASGWNASSAQRRGGNAYTPRLHGRAPQDATHVDKGAVFLSATEHERLLSYGRSAAAAADWKSRRVANQRSASESSAADFKQPGGRRYLSRPQDTEFLLR